VTPEFLAVDDVLDLHTLQLARYGGASGLRDPGLLASAVAQPQATFGGEFVHEDVFAMAAAYLFHIVSNHPFVDGNKRTGLITALVFLDVNGIAIEHGSNELYALTIAVAEGKLTKGVIAKELRRLARADI
jgi:death on curing protein